MSIIPILTSGNAHGLSTANAPNTNGWQIQSEYTDVYGLFTGDVSTKPIVLARTNNGFHPVILSRTNSKLASISCPVLLKIVTSIPYINTTTLGSLDSAPDSIQIGFDNGKTGLEDNHSCEEYYMDDGESVWYAGRSSATIFGRWPIDSTAGVGLNSRDGSSQ